MDCRSLPRPGKSDFYGDDDDEDQYEELHDGLLRLKLQKNKLTSTSYDKPINDAMNKLNKT